MLQWFIFFIGIQVIHFFGTWKLYVKAGRQVWEAAIPIYNAVILMKIIKRPWWWVLLLFIPVINVIMFPVIWVEVIRSFGKNSKIDIWLAILSFGFYVAYINYLGKHLQYLKDRNFHTKTVTEEWIGSILFAVIVATLVHTYFMQPFTIPTGSLEKTLLVGDFLFVSKFHYGARIPITPVAAPMVHDTLPIIKTKSYTNWPRLPYFRFPGIAMPQKNDIIVYNWPADTVQQFYKIPDHKFEKPVDKKSNYVKRCVGTPGDSLEIKDGYIFINRQRLKLSDRAKPQYSYIVETNQPLDPKYMYTLYKVTGAYTVLSPGRMYKFTSLTEEVATRLKNNPRVLQLTKIVIPKGQEEKGIFPNDKFKWNRDNFGPIYIPEKGKTIPLNKKVLPLYRRIIEVYENNDLKIQGDKILINGTVVTHYTFKQNYYWGMGDNRHNSEDCRNWGYIPEDHIVGKVVFVWFSWDKHAKGIMNKIRWNRLFTTVHGEDIPRSYFPYFICVLIAYIVFLQYRKKRKKIQKV